MWWVLAVWTVWVLTVLFMLVGISCLTGHLLGFSNKARMSVQRASLLLLGGIFLQMVFLIGYTT